MNKIVGDNMAGLGPVCTNNRDLLKRAGYRTTLLTPENELEIYCSLCVGRVFYRESNRSLYFVDSAVISVTLIIRSVFLGLDQSPNIKQLYMDEHNLIKAALCILLSEQQKNSLFAALRLSGIYIDFTQR